MQSKEKDVIELTEIFRVMLEKLWMIILAAVCGGALTFGYSKFALPLKYSSHISMYIQCYTTFNENPDFNISSISTSKQLIKTYIEVIKDDAVMGAVAEKLVDSFDESRLRQCYTFTDEGIISPSSIRSSLNISSVMDTSALSLSVTTKDAEVASAVCNSIAEVAPDFIQEAVGAGSITTIDTAKVYRTPVAPHNTQNALLGAVAAAAIVMFILFLCYMFDNTVKDPETLGTQYNKAIIGKVRKYNTSKKNEGNAHRKLTDEDTTFGVVESYKSMRTNVTFALSPFEKKVFIVSSANPSEGKSSVTSNIAIAMAQSGSKVLLIDADLRKPVQHKIFEIGNKNGLSSAIGKMNALDDCISKNVMENLDVMTSGPIPPNPSELLASANMSVIMSQLQSRYNVIIIDTAPINIVTDAMALAQEASGVIMVVRYGKTKTDDIDEAMKKIEFARMNMLGFVVNDVRMTHEKGYYKNYSYSERSSDADKKQNHKAKSGKKA